MTKITLKNTSFSVIFSKKIILTIKSRFLLLFLLQNPPFLEYFQKFWKIKINIFIDPFLLLFIGNTLSKFQYFRKWQLFLGNKLIWYHIFNKYLDFFNGFIGITYVRFLQIKNVYFSDYNSKSEVFGLWCYYTKWAISVNKSILRIFALCMLLVLK